MKNNSQHTPHTFEQHNNELIIGGIRLSQLADRIGQTPFYAYERQHISQRIQQLRQALPSNIKLHYAIKANPMPAVVHHLSKLVDGFDVASAGELKTALDTHINATQISFAGPGKSEQELKQAIAAGCVIHVESVTELQRLHQLSQTTPYQAKIALRINPQFELKSAGMKMGGAPKQFGIDAEQAPQLLQEIHKFDVDFLGFHIFSGSQNLSASAIIDSLENTLKLAQTLQKYCPKAIRLLNLGGGFGIPYFPNEQPLEIKLIADFLHQKMPEIQNNFPAAELILELGRYLVGESGIYVSKIIDKKISRGQTFLVCDGGLHHHLAASGNFGQVLRKNYPVLIGNKLQAPESTSLANLVGNLCTPLDTLAWQMPLAHAEIGDLAVIFQSGAYGLSASPHFFLGHQTAIEVIV